MPIYNNPAFAQAASNLSQLFAPPSGADAAGWATARAKQDEAARLSKLFELAQMPEPNIGIFDRMGSAAGQWNPTQGYGARDMADATNRYGIDTTAATSRMNNTADNQASVLGKLFQPLNEGQVRPELPGSIASQYGMPGVDVPAVAGNPKPLSETEWQASQNERLRQSGGLTDQMMIDQILGEKSPVQAVGPDGATPQFMSPGAAVRTGAQPYINEGSKAKPSNAMGVLPDGQQVPAVQDADTGKWRHAQTGEELPVDVRIFDMAKPQGTAEEVGVSKPTNSAIEKQLIDVAVAKNTAVRLRDLIAQSPASQGIVGWMRGTAQNIVQSGGEVGQYFGGQMAEVDKAINSGLADAGLAEAFDPNIPAIEMMANLLAFQYAKTTTGERLSNEMLRNAKAALGLEGLTANQASSLTRLDRAISLIEDNERILNRARTGGVQSISSPAPAGAPTSGMPASPQAPVQATPTVRRYNPATGKIE